jgi:hypothetical protein
MLTLIGQPAKQLSHVQQSYIIYTVLLYLLSYGGIFLLNGREKFL